MQDPYAVLEVDRNATQKDIKRVYRKLAKELHPDLHPGNKAIGERFKEVSAAYALLGDADKRARYDRGEIDASGAPRVHAHFSRGFTGAPQGEGFFAGVGDGGFNPEDLFADFFSGFRGRGRGRDRAKRTFRARGADRRYTLKVSFLDATRGSKQRLTLTRGKTLDVTIPAGIENGQTIRLKDQGESGRDGAPSGDALIAVEVVPHPVFSLKGKDIHVEAPVTLPEAVLGARIEVPTIHGAVSLKVPKGSNSGTTLRLKGKGIVDRKAGTRGDQYVELKVMLPEKRDPELERLIAEWAKDHDYVVRAKRKPS